MTEAPPTEQARTGEIVGYLQTMLRRNEPARVELFKCGTLQPVMSWTIAGLKPEAELVDELAGEMGTTAARHGKAFVGSGAGGTVNYELRGKRADGSDCGAHPFFVPGAPKAHGIPEDMNLAAGFASTMKMYNELGGVLVRAFAGRDDAWKQQNELLLQQNIELRKEHHEVLQMHQKHVLFEAERRRLDAGIAREEKKDDWIMENLGGLLPLIANRLAGGGPGKGAPAAPQMLEAFFSGFSAETLEMLMGPGSPLTETQKMIFQEAYMSVMRPKVTRLNAAAAAEDKGKNGVSSKDPPS